MKLISLNVEGSRHLERVKPFFKAHAADAICLYEANAEMRALLESLGYVTTFLPIIISSRDEIMLPEGCLVATKLPHEVTTHYYYRPPDPALHPEDRYDKRTTTAQGVILATVPHADEYYTIATTHFTWTPQGEVADQNQRTDAAALMQFLNSQPPHVLCGDFNIPRHQNPLYEQFLEHYTDVVPDNYTSSLDKQFHYLGDSADHQHLFTDFMVDHLLTQAPYEASDVSLTFGVSDHAAVVAEITKQTRACPKT